MSVISRDGKTHVVELEAASLFDAAARAARQWAMLWWWPGNATVVEVRAKGHSWKVSVEQVRAWEQRPHAGKV